MLLPKNARIDETSKVEVVVNIEPRGKGRPRAVGRKLRDGSIKVGTHTDKKTADWKERFVAATLFAKMKHKAALAHLRGRPIRFELELYFERPKTNKSWWCNARVDNDNSEKNVWDAMQDEVTRFPVGRRIEKLIVEGFIQDDFHIVSNETVKAWAQGAPLIIFRIFALIEDT